ncbi:electron transfer flavoprotein subunit beta [Terriglobus sp. 2YAB30_2]|uniref:electron transfer flavoprotein subunit beta/FixA family protein n=1 Tax=unclassified Terriglobus TaxID=2628988 RepID=UPI003F98933F
MGLRVLSVIRQVLDAEESVKIKDGVVDLSSSKLVLDTMDEYGLEEALRIRDVLPETEVVALAVGPARCEEALRTALAIGADRAILVETSEPLDVITVGNVVAQVARKEQSDLIFCGGQEADWDSQALGASIAEYLKWPQLTWTTALNLEGRTLTGTHDVEEGTESFKVELPAIVTTQQGLCEPRYPTLPNIMKAKKKDLRRDSFESFGVRSKLKFIRSEIQVKERMRRILDGKDGSAAAQQLVEFLRNETRVIG